MHRHFVTLPYLKGLSAEERALASFAIGCIDESRVPRQLAESAMRRGNWTGASAIWEELRLAFPEDASGYVRGAAALLGAGRLDEAEALAGEAMERFPDRPGGHVHRAEVAMRRKDWALATERWEAYRRAFPDHSVGYVRGAAALLGAGRVDEAEALAGEATERFPDRPGGHVHRAEVAMRRKDWALATERWDAYRRAFPDHSVGYVRGAAALLGAGRVDEAEALAGEATERFPDRPGGHVHRAEVAMRRKDWALATERWDAYRGAFPDHSVGYVRGAEALLNAGRPDEAEAVAVEAVERFPDHPGGHRHRADIAMRRRDGEAARGSGAYMGRARADHPAGRAGRQAPSQGRVGHRADSEGRLWRFKIALFRGREALMALVAPAQWWSSRVVGAVENCELLQVRGWLLDRGDPERKRSVAIHLEGRLPEVIVAEGRRDDIARWRGTDGYHGFLWQIPEDLAATDGARIDVFDAVTGVALRGSPARIEGGRVVASERRRR